METEPMIKCEDLVFEYVKNQQAGAAGSTKDKAGAQQKENHSENGARKLVRAVDGVSFTVDRGEFVVIIGENGSGKTTLAKCLNALFIPKSGNVTVNGWNTKDEKYLWNIRQTAGMVFQNPDNQLVSSIVEDDVAFGPENIGLPSELIRKRVDDALEMVGMSDAAKRAPHMLSGGQKQRIAIAGVIAMKPQCIIFDEPTAMLDPKGRKEVMDIIESLRKEGITIILITHFMDEAVHADKVLVMDNGKIIRRGTPKEIFTDKELTEMFEADLPCGVDLAMRLRAGGLDIPDDIVTESELAEYLAALDQSQRGAEHGNPDNQSQRGAEHGNSDNQSQHGAANHEEPGDQSLPEEM